MLRDEILETYQATEKGVATVCDRWCECYPEGLISLRFPCQGRARAYSSLIAVSLRTFLPLVFIYILHVCEETRASRHPVSTVFDRRFISSLHLTENYHFPWFQPRQRTGLSQVSCCNYARRISRQPMTCALSSGMNIVFSLCHSTLRH